jgi:peroxiredoxin
MTNQQTIAEQAAAFSQQMAATAPTAIVAIFAEEKAGLDAAGIPAGVTEVGAPMPDGALLDGHGQPTTLEQARNGRAAVVVFYRGAWCPYCNITLRIYQEQLVPALAERGVALIAISPQKPDGSLTMRETNALTFTVLSDPGNQIAGRLGILTAPTDAVQQIQIGFGIDVAGGNADGTNTLPMPTVVLVDTSGVIRWIDVHPNYATRSEPKQILEALVAVIG